MRADLEESRVRRGEPGALAKRGRHEVVATWINAARIQKRVIYAPTNACKANARRVIWIWTVE